MTLSFKKRSNVNSGYSLMVAQLIGVVLRKPKPCGAWLYSSAPV